jgi:diaminopropionate ammonia-lyase
MADLTDISYVANPAAREDRPDSAATSDFSPVTARLARGFHRSIPGYEPSPLVSLVALAADMGVGNVWIKDESKRFGLNAFKVLGASYAMASVLAERLGLPAGEVTFSAFDKPGLRTQLEDITVCTATDGNHGRAVAWAAEQLGCNCVVYMPRGTSGARFDAIAGHHADVSILDCNYDETVAQAAADAKSNDWALIQDTAWHGYEEVPLRIMQGYLTSVDEAMEQLHGQIPTHVFLQAGVGSLAGAAQAQFREMLGGGRPVVAVVEPTQAACCFASMAAGTRDPQSLEGDLPTIMAGLACGTPSAIAWNILRDHTDVFVACSDDVAATGMRSLAHPRSGDATMISGESGAVTAGLLVSILSPASQATFAELIEALMLDTDSRVLLISTEGDTDPDSYNRIVHR